MKLSNGRLSIVLDDRTGCFLVARDEDLGIDLVQEPRLAENFRILVPLAKLRGHYISGREQVVTGWDVAPDHASAVLTYGPLTSSSGTFDISVRLQVVLDGGDLRISVDVVNDTSFTVEEVTVLLGGIDNRTDPSQWRLHYPHAFGAGREWTAYAEFPGSYLGPRHPIWLAAYHSELAMPWIDIYHPQRRCGVTVAALDDRPAGALTAAFAQLVPHTVYRPTSGRPSTDVTQAWPDRDRLDSEPIGMALGWAHFPFVAAGRRWTSPDSVWHFHTGTWWAAADWYREWFADHFPAAVRSTRSWLADRDAWQSTIVSYPDDSIGFRFTDLPAMAETAKAIGIDVLQIDGWDVGGIDRNYPDYRPDPRLGTVEELRTALAECRRRGVDVLLFVNLQWANIETDEYRHELHRYAVKDPAGNARNSMGWEYNTTLGLMLQCESRMVMMNPSHPRFQELILDRLTDVIGLGARGMQIDKLGTHSAIDYAAPTGTEPSSSVMAGVLTTLAELVEKARQIDPEFAFAAETHWDRSLAYVDASYARYFSGDHLPTVSYTFPELRQTVCITGDDDYGLINNAVRFGHVINVEGAYLHGSAADMPRLAAYISQVLRMRRQLRDVLWDSRLAEPIDVVVDGDVLLSRHNGRDGRLSALVLNHFNAEEVEASVDVPGVSVAELWDPLCESRPLRLPAKVTVPRDRVVVIVWDQHSTHHLH